MKVIICAAGDSKRMGELTKTVPKPLLQLGEKSIIENILGVVAIKPVSEIIILVGYLVDQIKEKIGDSFNGIKVSYVRNEMYSDTNNMYSIYLAKDKIDEDLLFVSADVYLKAKTCSAFIKNKESNSVLIDKDSKHFGSDDPVKVIITHDVITAIDKKLSSEQINGVAVGMYRLSLYTFKEFVRIAGEFIKEGYMNYGYIEPIKILLKSHKFVPFYIGDEFWCDIDTPEEYDNIKKIVLEVEK